MPKYSFKVKAQNVPCHLDIERDLKEQSNGLFTFTIRVNQGQIMDYVNYRNPATSEYSAVFDFDEAECEISRSSGDGSPTD